MSKERISLSLSLRKKGRKETIGPIIDQWTEQDLDVSEEMANSIMTRNEIITSASLFKLHNTYDMIKQTLQYSIKDEVALKKAVEESMSKIVVIDGESLTEFFANPTTFTSVLDEAEATAPRKEKILHSASDSDEEIEEDDEKEEDEIPEVKVADKQEDQPLQRKKRPERRKPKPVESDDDDDDDGEEMDMGILNNM